MEKTLCYSELSGHTFRPDIKKQISCIIQPSESTGNEGCFSLHPSPAAPVAVFSPFRANCCQSVRGADCAARSHASAAPGQSPDFQPDSPASDLPVAPYPGVLRITPCSVHFPSPLIRAGECVINFYNLLLPGMEERFQRSLIFPPPLV